MRTTLDIDDDLLAAAKSVGGFRPLPAGDRVVTNEQVNALPDVEGV